MKKNFLTENFLLQSDFARELYFEHAVKEPIFDYHTHLPPAQMANDHRFENLFEIWLAGDHYKWRAMRSNGVPERFCTGDASPREKFDAFVATVPYTLRNPLYHWSHLELERYFGIGLEICPANANAIWELANDKLAEEGYSVHGLLERNRVAVVGTTDDPVDDLGLHQKIASSALKTRVYPTFRPDAAMRVGDPAFFNSYCDCLSAVSGEDCGTLEGLFSALRKRHDAFHEAGCRLSDHGLEFCPALPCTKEEAEKIFSCTRSGTPASPEEQLRFASGMMRFFGALDAGKGWTKQLHLGAMRGNNQRMLASVGADTGFDSIGDFPQAKSLSQYLSQLDSDGTLPKVVLYNLNPADNYVFATMIGNFQDGSVAGKIQWGSGWWFLDQKEGMEWQINALSQLGLLRRFVGMLTDSRSFLSYTRHEYFRRLLCQILGDDVKNGLLPADSGLLGSMVREICYRNALEFFGQPVHPHYQPG